MATGTYVLPPNNDSFTHQTIDIANDSTNSITALSVTAPGSGTVYGAPTSLSAGQRITVRKVTSSSNGIWSAK
jgi:hypothetical protein